ncbi:hypothetical protein VIGAN_08200800 [Vigna angularis var. angularis]|uniref:Auxin-induced protein n=2 Tax=Phaseolus angularis TaxID=3914 RepID=A0A0S3SR82_PHAAN|nr:hypothetical protein VIGAN_08200800 [Vigna angularis var. angularis]
MQCLSRRTSKYGSSQETSCVFPHDLNINTQFLLTRTPTSKFTPFKLKITIRYHHPVLDFTMMRSFVGKIQKGVSQIVPGKPALNYINENQLENTGAVPEDVSKGYFAVIAIKDGEIKRFVVELDYLTNPAFLGLLDQAGEEYGFKQQGTLAVPCKPKELQKILDGWRVRPDTIKAAGRDLYVPKFL